MRRQVYSCDICSAIRKDANHWFIISFVKDEFRISRWDELKANKKGAIHVCGSAHAHQYLDQYTSGKADPANVCELSVAV